MGVLPTLEKRPVLQKKLRDIEKVYTSFYNELGEEYLTAEELLGVLSRLVPQSEKIRGKHHHIRWLYRFYTAAVSGIRGNAPMRRACCMRCYRG